MGFNITCGACGTEVYTTGTRFPPHKTAENEVCHNTRPAREPVEYTVGSDSDLGVYQGGLPELGKDR